MPKKRKVKRSKAKKSVRKKAVRKKKPGKKVKKAAKKKTKVLKTPELPSEPIGRVTHYFSKARATAFLIEREGVRLGDTLYFKGHTTNFKQKVESLQIDRQPVSQAGPEEEVGLRTRSRTREHDLVFKL
jgi:putative protease